ncbi:MAG: formate dehydrogenase [Gammaproteobacteria bacterium]|nr:formate dehydrogenase [Gammaproteobacteria bacterium]NIM74544.1 formate dehydrogenase [Gammaproteobacteria bacterium]NIO26377.1 formate dehydrogenase [Gammaproteobacteria bacterium]NIO66929.1 formate dehydrogenase [Gammaproteobacteria bacterium]NIP44939.1 formate dehydrogenase [Gammaproteobacteria bacterium]
MSKTPKLASGRRTFLKRAAVAGGAATVAVAGGAAVADIAPESAGDTAPSGSSKGYRMTPHIEAYYRSARR